MIPEGDFKTQVQTLSQQPGLAYIGELAKDPKVNWSQVKLAYDKWDYSQEGLTPAGAAVLAIAVAAYTGGMGAELLGGTAGTAATASTAAMRVLPGEGSTAPRLAGLKSYSLRIVISHLIWTSLSCGNQTRPLVVLGVTHHQ